jgi:energy-coupling factor transporter transmembrane protein EcfT
LLSIIRKQIGLNKNLFIASGSQKLISSLPLHLRLKISFVGVGCEKKEIKFIIILTFKFCVSCSCAYIACLTTRFAKKMSGIVALAVSRLQKIYGWKFTSGFGEKKNYSHRN